MRSGHGGNSIFFNENNKDCTSRTIATPHPLHPIASHFCLTNPHPLPPPLLHTHTYIHTNTHTHTHTPSLKVDVICVSPLIKFIKAYVVVEILTLVKQFKILNNTSLLTINQDQPNMLLIIRDTPSWRVMKNTPSREVIYFLVIKIAGHEKT